MSAASTLSAGQLAHARQEYRGNVQGYLEMMMTAYTEGTDQCLFLPSLLSLSECFHCSPVEVHQTLEQLKSQGCDFFIMSFESPITLWFPSRLGLEEGDLNNPI